MKYIICFNLLEYSDVSSSPLIAEREREFYYSFFAAAVSRMAPTSAEIVTE
jgi:hypothetical protein